MCTSSPSTAASSLDAETLGCEGISIFSTVQIDIRGKGLRVPRTLAVGSSRSDSGASVNTGPTRSRAEREGPEQKMSGA